MLLNIDFPSGSNLLQELFSYYLLLDCIFISLFHRYIEACTYQLHLGLVSPSVQFFSIIMFFCFQICVYRACSKTFLRPDFHLYFQLYCFCLIFKSWSKLFSWLCLFSSRITAFCAELCVTTSVCNCILYSPLSMMGFVVCLLVIYCVCSQRLYSLH
jgi:hypothetical protein